MGPISHSVISAAIGTGVWILSDGNPLVIPAAVCAGVLIDGDHIIDYLDARREGYRRYLLVLAHGWEWGFIFAALLLAWHHPLAISAFLAYTANLAADSAANRTHPLAYWLFFRLYKRFNYQILVRDQFPGTDVRSVNIFWRIEPWSRPARW